METLKRWVNDDARLIAVLGMGGIGKTMLAARLAAWSGANAAWSGSGGRVNEEWAARRPADR
jgi:predicted ATPase